VLFFVFVFIFAVIVTVSYRSYADIVKQSIDQAIQDYAKCVIQAVPGEVCILKKYFSYGYSLFVAINISFVPSGIGAIILGFNKYTISWYKRFLQLLLSLCSLEVVIKILGSTTSNQLTESSNNKENELEMKNNSKFYVSRAKPVLENNMFVLDRVSSTSTTITSDTLTP